MVVALDGDSTISRFLAIHSGLRSGAGVKKTCQRSVEARRSW
jgi:hypothetical protein